MLRLRALAPVADACAALRTGIPTAKPTPMPTPTLTAMRSPRWTSSSSLGEQQELLGVQEGSTRAAVKRAFEIRAREEKDEQKSLKLQEAKRSLMQHAGTTKYLFIGRPGTGKSTLLNGLLGEVVFKSGPSAGKGLTFDPDRRMIDGDTFISTPCLADEKLRAAAAAAITEALREGGQFKVLFVLTMESGRLRPEDKATIQLVLNSAPIIAENFGIVVNKVSRNLHQKALFQDYDYVAQHWGGKEPPKHVIANRLNEELEDEEGKLVPLAPELFHFIESLPIAFVESEEVKLINYETFRAVQQQFFEGSFTKLEQQSEELQRTGMAALEKMYTQKLAQLEEKKEAEKLELQQQCQEQLVELQAQNANECKKLRAQLQREQQAFEAKLAQAGKENEVQQAQRADAERELQEQLQLERQAFEAKLAQAGKENEAQLARGAEAERKLQEQLQRERQAFEAKLAQVGKENEAQLARRAAAERQLQEQLQRERQAFEAELTQAGKENEAMRESARELITQVEKERDRLQEELVKERNKSLWNRLGW